MAQGYDTDQAFPPLGAPTDTKTLFGPTMGWQRSLFTLVTLVGVWAIFHGVGEVFAAFSVRETGRRAERLVG